MPSIAPHCHELRVRDQDCDWRLVYRLDSDAVLILAVFAKSTGRTPYLILHACRARLRRYDDAARGDIR